MSNAPALRPGTLLNHGQYRVETVLGRGGFGITYLAQDLNVGVGVAVKELFVASGTTRSADGHLVVGPEGVADFAKLRERFRLEAQTLSRLRHPAIVQVRSLFEANGTVYLVMEYLEGQTLEAALRARGRMAEPEVRGWMVPLLGALAEIHAANLLHRDLKPDNVMLTAKGPVLIDFGAALELASDQARHTVVYTPTYAPLEQLGGAKLTPATDLFGLCATAYRCLTLSTPVPATQRLNGTPLPSVRQLNPAVSEGFARLLEAGLALKVGERPQSASEMLEAIRSLAAVGEELALEGNLDSTVLGRPAQALDDGEWYAPAQPATWWKRTVPWLGLAAVAATGLASWSVLGRGPTQNPALTPPFQAQPTAQTQPIAPNRANPAPTPASRVGGEFELSSPRSAAPTSAAITQVRLRLETNTPQIQALLGGRRLALNRPMKVGARYHFEVVVAQSEEAERLEIRAEGFRPYGGQVGLGQDRNLLVLLERQPVRVQIFTNRPDATLWLNRQLADGRAVRSGGRYVLEVQQPYGTRGELEVRAAAHRTLRRRVSFEREGRLEFSLQPLPKTAPRPPPAVQQRRPAKPSSSGSQGGCDVKAGSMFCR
ncbi:MAG: serine/threonine-protein kinase [Meiothermus sp.]|nr:serine/threonine-protein kinase [Meiothermus sp.]